MFHFKFLILIRRSSGPVYVNNLFCSTVICFLANSVGIYPQEGQSFYSDIKRAGKQCYSGLIIPGKTSSTLFCHTQ